MLYFSARLRQSRNICRVHPGIKPRYLNYRSRLEITFCIQWSWEFLRIFMMMISRIRTWSPWMKNRLPRENKRSAVTALETIFSYSGIMSFDQNVCVQNLCQVRIWVTWSQNYRLLARIKWKPCWLIWII